MLRFFGKIVFKLRYKSDCRKKLCDNAKFGFERFSLRHESRRSLPKPEVRIKTSDLIIASRLA